MRLAMLLICAGVGGASAEPHERPVIDVDRMAQRDCVLARRLVTAPLCFEAGTCGTALREADVCQLRWSEPPLVECTPRSRVIPHPPHSLIVEILRTAEQLVD